MDRDLRGEVLVRVVAQVLAQRVGELQLAGLGKLRDRDRREHLVHRSDAEASVEPVGGLLVAVRRSPGAREDGLSVAGHKQRAGEPVARDFRFDLHPQRSEPGRLSGSA